MEHKHQVEKELSLAASKLCVEWKWSNENDNGHPNLKYLVVTEPGGRVYSMKPEQLLRKAGIK